MSDTPQASRGGCARHLWIIAGLIVVALGILVARNPDALQRLFANQQAMQEGSEEARALTSPTALVDWIAAHPEQASLVVREAGGEVLLDVNGRTPRPVAGLPALWVAAEWAEQAASGRLDTTAVPPERLAVRRLPGTGAVADTAAMGPRLLVDRMLNGDRAAESVLLARLGPDPVAVRARRYGVEPPVPFEGILLAWQAGDTMATNAGALARRLARDAPYREDVIQEFQDEGFRLTLNEQRLAAAAALPQGTAAAYARLLADALVDSLASPEASALFLDALAAPDSVGGTVQFGSKGGGFPGHLALAAWVQPPNASSGRVAVLMLEDLPLGLFYHLSQTGLDAGLVLRLLTDDAFLAQTAADLDGTAS